jgi:hypothetical protein
MAFAPSMPPSRDARKPHNETVRRIYRTWTPWDLYIYELNLLGDRANVIRMVRDDYSEVVRVTARLALHGVARLPRIKARNAPARTVTAAQLWRKRGEPGKLLKVLSACADPKSFAVCRTSEDGSMSWSPRITRGTTISRNYTFVRDL